MKLLILIILLIFSCNLENKSDETTTKSDETTTKSDETTTKSDETTTKSDETTTKTDEIINKVSIKFILKEEIEYYANHELTKNYIVPKALKILKNLDTPDFFNYPDPENRVYHELSFQKAGNDLLVLGFSSIISDNTDIKKGLIKAINNICNWKSWGGKDGNEDNRDHALQYMLRGAAYTYNWLKDDIPEELKKIFMTKLSRETLKMYEASTSSFNQEWGNWWHSSYQQNHWSTNNSALGLASMALLEEFPEAKDWLLHAVDQLKIKKDILNNIKDGTWHEGLQYQSADLLHMIPFWKTFKNNFSDNLEPSLEYITNFILWRKYNLIPGQLQGLLEFSDYVPEARGALGWHSNIVAGYFASEYNLDNGHILKKEIESTALDSIGWFRSIDDAAYMIYEVLYYKKKDVTNWNELSLDKYFKDQNAIIWRSGWSNNDLVFGVRYSPYLGEYLNKWNLDNTYNLEADHAHRDAGSFSIYLGSENLTSEISGLQYNNTTALHNTLLIKDSDSYDNGGQYRSEWGALYGDSEPKLLTNYSSSLLSYHKADLTDRYRVENGGNNPPGKYLANKILRGFTLIKNSFNYNNYILAFDYIIPNSKNHEASWNMFLPPGKTSDDIESQNNGIKININNNNSIIIEKISPSICDLSFHAPINSFGYQIENSYSSDYLSWTSTLNNITFYLMLIIPENTNLKNPDIELVSLTEESILLKEISPDPKYIFINPLGKLTTNNIIESDGELVIIDPNKNEAPHYINTSYLLLNDKIILESQNKITSKNMNP